MNTAILALLAPLAQTAPEQLALETFRQALDSRSTARVEALFAHKEHADYLLEMAGRDGLASLDVRVIPVPPRWTRYGSHWVVFSKAQGIQSYHDAVHVLARTPDGFLVGSEVPQTATGGYRIRHARLDVALDPPSKSVAVTAHLELEPGEGAAVFRLNEPFVPTSATLDGRPARVLVADDKAVPSPRPGDLLRAGGLLIAWTDTPIRDLTVSYHGVVNSPGGDKISDSACYLTANWVPSIGRLPHTTATRVRGPKDWVIVSEGLPVSEEEGGFPAPVSKREDERVEAFRCDVPISFPKVIGGRYSLAAEDVVGGKAFRSYQLEPVDRTRAERDVRIMREAAAFYEKNLGPLPFPGYACFDADTYYGIESYSYTLLNRRITTRFVSHELGHTYFGGLVPCSYTRDTWNEGMTQYVDSVLFQNDRDGTLEAGLRTLGLAVPLTKMPIPHLYGSATYYRGAYVMRMLENEIGLEKVFEALRLLIRDRRGVDTSWPELLPYFEKAAGRKLDWFWEQWIAGASFPLVEAVQAQIVEREGRASTFVTVRQSGTPRPFRLRFKVVVSLGSQRRAEQVVTLDSAQATYRVDSDFLPEWASVEVFGLALARTGQPLRTTR